MCPCPSRHEIQLELIPPLDLLRHPGVRVVSHGVPVEQVGVPGVHRLGRGDPLIAEQHRGRLVPVRFLDRKDRRRLGVVDPLQWRVPAFVAPIRVALQRTLGLALVDVRNVPRTPSCFVRIVLRIASLAVVS